MTEPDDEKQPIASAVESQASETSLEQLVHDPSPEVLRAAATDSRLTEDLALVLLKRRDLPLDAVEAVFKNKSLAKLKKVQLAIVMHPHAPRHVTIPVIRHLYAFELMQVALSPTVPADVKRSAEEAIVARLATISSGERSELAKRGSGRIAAALLLDKEDRIMQSALSNPQMTEMWIVKALKPGRGTELLAPAVSHHQKWSQRIDVKVALIANPHTPYARVVQFAAEVPRAALKEVVRSARLPQNVKAYLKGIIENRPQ